MYSSKRKSNTVGLLKSLYKTPFEDDSEIITDIECGYISTGSLSLQDMLVLKSLVATRRLSSIQCASYL